MNSKTANKILLVTGILVLGLLSGCGTGPGPEPTPTPTPHPQEISDTFGIVWASSFGPEGWDSNTWPTQLAMDAGARWDRWPLEWSRVEPSPGQFAWSGADYDYDVAVNKDRGTSPQLNVTIVLGNIPEWFDLTSLDEPVFLNPEKTQPNPANQWGHFVYQASTRYQSTEDSTIAWKIGNEPPAKTFQEVSVEDYVEFISVACEVLSETDPQGIIVLGAPEHVPGVKAVRGERNWYWHMLRELRNKGVDSCIDAIAFHAYGGARHAEYLTVGGYDLWESRTGQDGVPVWMTETGVAHAGQPWCGELGKPPCANEDETADYVIQNYVWALQGAAERGYDPKVFHHHFRDTYSPDPRDGPWGLLHVDTTPYPAYYAAKLMVEKLNGATWYDDESQEGYFHRLVFKGQNDKFINVVWAVDDAVLGNEGVLLAHDGLSVATVYEITGSTEPNPWTLEALSDDSDAPYYPLELPAATAENGGDPYPGVPMIGGHTYILIESPATPPEGEASVICENSRAAGTDLWGYDADSGLASLSYACSPERTYDLSWTEPGRTYAGSVYIAPPKDGACTLTLTDRDGLSITQTIRDTCEEDPGSNPGGDHPDDNLSAASLSIPDGDFVALPKGARTSPQVAILNRGAAHGLWRTLLQIGEPSVRIGTDFDPVATAARYPVLLIPSGGLHGMASSPLAGGSQRGVGSFRARLEEYARRGGTVVAFAQQRASERIGESANPCGSWSAVLLYRHTIILVYADGEPGRLFVVHLVIVRCPPPPPYVSA